MKAKIFLVVLFCAACSPQARLARLLHRNPTLAVCDTLTLHDTLISPLVKIDTSASWRRLTDTLYLERGRLEVRVSRIHDTIHVTGRCKADTVVINRRVPVEKIRLVKADNRGALIGKIPWIAACVIAICVVIAVGIGKAK